MLKRVTPGQPANPAISLTGFKDPADVRAFIERAEARGIRPLFELSYNLDESFLKTLSRFTGFTGGRVVSVHAPCPSRVFFPNLGSLDADVVKGSLKTIAASARTATRFGAANLVLHPGYTFDEPVHLDSRRRLAVLEARLQAKREWIWIEEGSICRPEYCASEEYRLHLRQAFVNLKQASALCREEGVTLCAENMNPRVTYLFQTPADLLALCAADESIRICLDLGHLWLSSLVHGFDYLEAVERLCVSGRVVTTHIHDNRSTLGKNQLLADEHRGIGGGNIPLPAAVTLIRKHSRSVLVAETIDSPLENLAALYRLGKENAL
jgi:sugar phosphate isomerase/epimerase